MMYDPDDESTLLLGQPKNSLGRHDLPTLTMRIESVRVADMPTGPVIASRVRLTGHTSRSIRETIVEAGEGADDRTATDDAAGWLGDYLQSRGGYADSADVKRDGRQAGHAERALHRARPKVHAASVAHGFPRRTYWCLPGFAPGESDMTGITGTTEVVPPVVPVVPVVPHPAREGLNLRPWSCPAGADHRPRHLPDGSVRCGTCEPLERVP